MKNPFKPKVLDVGRFFAEAKNKSLEEIHEIFITVDTERMKRRDIKRMAAFLGVTEKYFTENCIYK